MRQVNHAHYSNLLKLSPAFSRTTLRRAMAITMRKPTPASESPKQIEQRLYGFIDKFDEAMARRIRSARKAVRKRLPCAAELVYDNYNFFVIGYGPNEKASEVVLSLASQAKGITLFFWHGTKLPDPAGLLSGSGKQVRSLQIKSAAEIARPEVEALIAAALALSKTPMPAAKGYTTIKSVSAKQRPRRAKEKK